MIINQNYMEFKVSYFLILIAAVFVIFLKPKQELGDLLELKVQERTKELQNALAAKTEFLNNMSHEIRTPIQGFLGLSEGLVYMWDKADNLKKFTLAKKVAFNAKRLANLVGNLLDIAKFNDGDLYLDLKKLDLVQSIDEIIEESKALYMNDKEIEIIFVKKQEKAIIIADHERISQVLRNLFVNAIKFSPKNSIIKIELENSYLNYDFGNKVKGIHFSITDEAVGIPPDEIEAIFESFQQSSRTKTKAGGTGLGLAISRKIVNAHHGKIWAENNKDGKGSSFHFIIPEIQEKNMEGHAAIEEKSNKIKKNNKKRKLNLKPKTIMVIDDEESVLATMDIILSSNDFKVEKADGGTKALEFIKEHPNEIDLIFLDLMMPDMYGLNVLKEIKKDKKTKNIPVIIQSGTADNEEKQKCLKSGAISFIAKPYNAKLILDSINSLFTKKRKQFLT